MQDFKKLKCYNCDLIVVDLSEEQIETLTGLNFFCECCGHQNLLIDNKLIAGQNSTQNTTSIFDLVCFI